MTGRCVIRNSWPSGSTYSKRVIFGVSEAGQRLHAAKPVTSAAATAAAAMGRVRFHGGLAGTLDCRAGGAAPSKTPSSASQASPMSRMRCVRSLCRQRRRSVATPGGRPAGSSVQSGSRVSTAASTSAISWPANARFPVSIS